MHRYVCTYYLSHRTDFPADLILSLSAFLHTYIHTYIHIQGGEFFSPQVTSGPVPVAIMAILGAYVYTSLNNHHLFKDPKHGLEDLL